MTARSIKERLKAGEKILAGWVYGLSPVTAEIMALAGYSALLIDQEHGPTELQMIHSQTVHSGSLRTHQIAIHSRNGMYRNVPPPSSIRNHRTTPQPGSATSGGGA